VLDLLATIEAAELPSGHVIVSARGPLDERVASTLRDTLLPLAAADGFDALLDLGDAHGLDRATLDVIGHAAHMASCRGSRLGIVTRSPFVTSLLVESGVTEIATIYGSVKEAVRP
jgi:anti-anti-sigma factor